VISSPAYKERYTGVDVQFLDMGSREILERVRVERNRPQADLWWGAAHTTFQTAAEENLLTPFRSSWPTACPPLLATEKTSGTAPMRPLKSSSYNSEAVRAEDAPHDWDDVLDSKWRDKVLIRNPNPSDTMRVIFGGNDWKVL